MKRIEELEDFAYSQNYLVQKIHVNSNIKGCCLTNHKISAITVNISVIKNSADELCVLAEEIGHLETETTLPILDYIDPNFKKWLKRKNEILAMRWAIDRILPFNKLEKALREHENEWEATEELDVTIEFFRDAVEYYRRKGLMEAC